MNTICFLMNSPTLQAHIDNTFYQTLWPSDMNLSNKTDIVHFQAHWHH